MFKGDADESRGVEREKIRRPVFEKPSKYRRFSHAKSEKCGFSSEKRIFSLARGA
jgi:hypothetical protein